MAPLDAGASGGGSLHLEKSMGGRPGGGGRYPDIPAAGIPGAVMPPEEAVTLHPGDPLLPGSTMEGRLPCKHTWSPSGSRSGNTPIQLSSQADRVEPQLGGSHHCPGWVVAPLGQR